MDDALNTKCILCNAEYQDKMVNCLRRRGNCKNNACIDCLRKWFDEHERDDQVICRNGPQCLCGEFGFRQSSYYTKKYVTKELLLKSERQWIFSKLKKMYEWEDLFIKSVIREYIQFIKLKIALADVNDNILAPSPIIDMIWVFHIKNQEKYITFCTRVNKNNIILRNKIKPDDESIIHYNQKYSNTLSLLSNDSFREIDIWIPSQFCYRPNVQIFVILLDGKYATIEANISEPVIIFKYRIQLVNDTDPNNMRLIYAGRQLDDNRSLEFYKIGDTSTIHLVGRMRGD